MGNISLIISIIVLIVILLFVLFIVSRLFVYTLTLEDEVKKNREIQNNILRSLSEIVNEDLLNEDGRLKKMRIQKPKKPIINDLGGEQFIDI